jgi:hypothetical protein
MKFIKRNIGIKIKNNLFLKVKKKLFLFLFDILLIGIPVVFAEELDEKIEQTHTPLVMRIEKAPVNQEQEQNQLEKASL